MIMSLNFQFYLGLESCNTKDLIWFKPENGAFQYLYLKTGKSIKLKENW